MKGALLLAFLIGSAILLVLWFRDIIRQDREEAERAAREECRREGFELFLRSVREHLRR